MIERSYKRKASREKYHAVVIDGHKVVKTAVFIAAIGLITGIIITSLSKNELPKENTRSEVQEEQTVSSNNSSIKEFFSGVFKSVSIQILGFDPYTPTGALAAEIQGADMVNSYDIVKNSGNIIAETATPEPQPTEAPNEEMLDENSSDIKAINAAQNSKYDSYQIRIGNQTSYGVDVNELLSEPLDIDMSAEGPKVLIVHTHATEAYAAEGAQKYNREESDRSMDTSENVVSIGAEVAQMFNERGIETLHDTKLHDYPSFNGSYADALSSIEDYLDEYPGIQVVFDIHRDSIVYDDGTKAKVITEIDGKNAAQLMFVVGTNEKGLYHPEWRENLKFAVQLQDRIDQKYPNLMRYVNLRQERFNGHTTKGSVIIEVGSSGNSLSEAKLGMRCAAECIAEFLNELK